MRRSALAKLGVDTAQIVTWPDWTLEGMEQFYVTMKAALEDEPGSFFAVAIDSTTALAHSWLEASVQESLARPAMQKKHPDRPPWDVFQEDYGALTEKMRSVVVRKLFTLPCHVVLVAHARRGETEDGLVKVGPDLSPAVTQSLITYSDWVLRMTMKETDGNVVRTIHTQPVGQFDAKDRFNVLDRSYDDVDLMDLFSIWENEVQPY